MAVEFRRFRSAEAVEEALFSELRAKLSDTDTPTAEPLVVMLSGGSTPIPIYRRLADNPPPAVHPEAHLMLSDDRYVSHSDERSNYHHIKPLADALGISEERVIHVPDSVPLADAVQRFNDGIAGLSKRNAMFSFGVLGIGPDGHTASLFSTDAIGERGAAGPEAPSATAGGRLPVDAVDRCAIGTGPHGGLPRVTVTPPVLFAFRRLVFLATGENKRLILRELSRRPEDFPAGRIMVAHPAAEIWTDEAPHGE